MCRRIAQSGEAFTVILAGKDEGLSLSCSGRRDGGRTWMERLAMDRRVVHLLWGGGKGESRLHIAGIILSKHFFPFHQMRPIPFSPLHPAPRHGNDIDFCKYSLAEIWRCLFVCPIGFIRLLSSSKEGTRCIYPSIMCGIQHTRET